MSKYKGNLVWEKIICSHVSWIFHCGSIFPSHFISFSSIFFFFHKLVTFHIFCLNFMLTFLAIDRTLSLPAFSGVYERKEIDLLLFELPHIWQRVHSFIFDANILSTRGSKLFLVSENLEKAKLEKISLDFASFKNHQRYEIIPVSILFQLIFP